MKKVSSSEFAKLSQRTFTSTLNAISAAQFAAFAFYNQNLTEESQFALTFAEFKSSADFLKKNGKMDLDFDKILGFDAHAVMYAVKGGVKTTINEILGQMEVFPKKYL